MYACSSAALLFYQFICLPIYLSTNLPFYLPADLHKYLTVTFNLQGFTLVDRPLLSRLCPPSTVCPAQIDQMLGPLVQSLRGPGDGFCQRRFWLAHNLGDFW